MALYKTLLHHRRSFFYAIVIAIGLVALREIANSQRLWIFLVAVGILGLALGLELFITYRRAAQQLRQFDLPDFSHYQHRSQLLHHLLIPILLLLALAGFIYTNSLLDISGLYFLIGLILYSILLINISAYYEDKFVLEERTHSIYDMSKVLIYFCTLVTLLNISSRLNFDFYIVVGLVFSLCGILTFFVLIRRRYVSIFNIALILLASLCLGYVTASIDGFIRTSVLVEAYFSTLLFYILNALVHHELDKTLRLSIVLEYVITAVISFLLVILLA